jgi:hypothetical protein
MAGMFVMYRDVFIVLTLVDLLLCFVFHRIAAIKQLLCVYDEAIKEYQQILDQQPGYVPALKGANTIL